MNLKILNTEIQDYIANNLDSDISKLIFKGSPFQDISILDLVEQIEAKNKCKTKLPLWFEALDIYYPNKLNIEQTSSEIAADYKSQLISGDSIIDLTGGFGVDSYFFSKRFKTVSHCEIDEKLSNIARTNFKVLKTGNIQCINANGIDYLKQSKKTYNWIFVDPSRRHNLKGKVFYLKDCLPNLVQHLDTLFEYSNNIMIKASPMLDLSIGISELKYVKEIHIIALKNDVKELLFILEKGFNTEIKVKTINCSSSKNQRFEFNLLKESKSQPSYSNTKHYLYEPNAAMMKSGAFNLISKSFNLDKLHPNTHLYTSDELIDFPGRKFKIKKVIPYKKTLIGKEINSKKFNITTRNFPESVAQIRKKFKVTDGGFEYLFFTTNYLNKRVVIFAEKA